MVRDKIKQGIKNFSKNEGEVTLVFFDIGEFDKIVQSYSTKELITFLDEIYNVFDQLSD